ncbi:hypothetical protein JCM11641_002430 [Rhodosporidiobolus odoratus]
MVESLIPTTTIDWNDPAVTTFLGEIMGKPNPTRTALEPSISAALQSMLAKNLEASAEINPLRAALPAFTYAMPVQLVIQGVTITLLGLLLVHLLFTIRYHAPLSRVNYILQTMATVLSLANVAAQLHIVMNTLIDTGQEWPFMFDYIEVAIPKKSWSNPKRAAWFFLQGLNALATHSTHIQFLTMLFPSSLEARLILGLLGPLALATAGLYFTAMSPHAAVNDLGDAVRNTANSSLTLLYTMALWIWGLTLNRSRAWRLDGGTAAFGILALILGVLGTAVNFVEIKEERMRWLPGVVTCILLWQSWVGFWWWVGAGMWAGEAEDVEKKREKQRRKEEQRRRKREGKRKVVEGEEGVGGEATATRDTVAGSLRRRLTGAGPSRPSHPDGESIELQDLSTFPEATGAGPRSPTSPIAPATAARTTGSDSNSSTISSSRPSTNHFYTPFTRLFSPFLSHLRSAHDAAAVARAAKPPGLSDDVRRGIGIRALMQRGKKERGERRQAARGMVEEGGEMNAGERRAGFELDGGERLEEEEEENAGREGEEWVDEAMSSGSSDSEEAQTRRRDRLRRREERTSRRQGEGGETHAYPPHPPDLEAGEAPEASWRPHGAEGQQSWWWRGLVGRWRLKDVSQW